ncbi:S-layer homology domain-containing protein [Clostridiaceae bacterium 35-E11]
MKRKISLLLVFFMCISIIQPINAFGAMDKGLETVIKTAKQKLEIPETFTEFHYDMYTVNGENIWNLSWRSKKDEDGNIRVAINGEGKILEYNFHKYEQYEGKKFPKYNRDQAKRVAEQFIKKMDENLLDQLKYQDNAQNRGTEGMHAFRYTRMIHDIPFYENQVSIGVNSETGQVQYFYLNWTEDVSFPKPENIISLEAAQKFFEDQLGLKLIYRYRYEDSQGVPYLVYAAKYPESYGIDAFTGRKIKIPYGGIYAKEESKAMDVVSNRGENIQLSPEELKAVQETAKFISKEEAEKIARGIFELQLNPSLELSNANLSRDWPMRDVFTWHLYFRETEKEEGQKVYQHTNVSIDALTGEVKSFYISDHYEEEDQALYDENTSQKAVEAFLKKFAPDKFQQTFYDKQEEQVIPVMYMGEEKKSLSYTFTYTRKVNDIPFEDNYIRVRYNAVTGKIVSFDMRWFDIHFPTTNLVISFEQVYKKLFDEIQLELQYKGKARDIRIPFGQKEKKEPTIELIYGIKPGKPVSFDASTGEILNNNGTPYQEMKTPQYTDIKGHEAEKQINTLAEHGIGFKESEFKPDIKILQEDFFRLLVKTVSFYGGNEKEKDYIDNMYRYLIREGILKQEEKAPKATMTREEGVKFIIRVLKYDEVASIEGIYHYPFQDMKEVSEDLVGHITIAKGMRIVAGKNGRFGPKEFMTRAEAAKIIYNYLQR